MTTLILDGWAQSDPTCEQLLTALSSQGPQTRTIRVRERRMGNCTGEFDCWVRTPGTCRVNDSNRLIAANIVASDLLVLVTPITFGGYSAVLKQAVDHSIQNLSPLFRSVHGQTHHHKRYRDQPDLLVVGWSPEPDPVAEAVFAHLVHRHGANLRSTRVAARTVIGRPSARTLLQLVSTWFGSDGALLPTLPPALPRPLPTQNPALCPTSSRSATHLADGVGKGTKRAVLLIGSPRTTNSSSSSLGGYLLERLAARGVSTQTVQVHTTMGSRTRRVPVLETLAQADLVILAFPLYVDSLPAPVISALDHLARDRAQREKAGGGAQAPATQVPAQRLLAIANCGFPEAEHNSTALAICERFAAQCGYLWAGGLAVGGGEMLVRKRPLVEGGDRTLAVRETLDQAATALADGGVLPETVAAQLAQPAVAPWAYRFLASWAIRFQARQNRVLGKLGARPYPTRATAVAEVDPPIQR